MADNMPMRSLTGYKVFLRAEGAAFSDLPDMVIADPATTVAVFDGLPRGAKRYVVVKAVANGQDSAPSIEMSAIVP